MAKYDHSIENLRDWQNKIVEQAKKNLQARGTLQPMAFFLTYKMNLEEDLLQNLDAMKLSTDQAATHIPASDIPHGEPIILILPLLLGPEEILSILKQTVVSSPDQLLLLDTLEKRGHQFGVTNPAASVAKALMNVMNLHEKDIVVMLIKLMIKRVDAFAYVKIDETWTVNATTELTGIKTVPADDDDPTKTARFDGYQGSLEHHPDAKEAITSFLETDGYTRMVNVIFHRDVPNTGTVTGFDPPSEMVETADLKSSALSGRFSHLFHKAKAEPRSPVPPNAS